MRCSNCARHVKPVVALDIDGTLSEYHEPLLAFAEGWLGKYVMRRYDGSCSLAEWMGVTPDVYRAVKLAYRQGGMKRVQPMYPDAQDLVFTLLGAGCEVWITTTRPYNRFDSTDPDTREWLRRNVGEFGTHYDGLIYDDHKYERLLEAVGPDRVIGIVDDLPEQVSSADALGLMPLFIHREHNQHSGGMTKVSDLKYAARVLTQRAEGWYAAQEA